MMAQIWAQKKDDPKIVLFLVHKRDVRLYAAGRLGKASHLTGSFTRTRREKLVDVFQLEAGNFGENTNHRSDTVLLVVVLKKVDNFLMFVRDVGDTFTFLDEINPLRGPLFEIQQKTIFINIKLLALIFDHCHRKNLLKMISEINESRDPAHLLDQDSLIVLFISSISRIYSFWK